MTRYHKTSPAEFDAFHAAHPEVYESICKRARLMQKYGHKRLSFRMLFEVTRCELMPIKINNTWCPMYCRLVIKQEPDLAGLFRIYPAKVDIIRMLELVEEVA